MKLSEIQSFLAVAATGSIRSAAKLRGLTAPALTKGISRLEGELHASLIVRTTRGALLTEYGEAFLHRAMTISNEISKASEEITQLQGRFSGMVTVGVSMSPAMTVIPPALLQFRREHPGVKVRLIEGPYQHHLGGIRAGTMDFAVGAVPLTGLNTDFKAEHLFENELVIVTRIGSPLAKATSLKDLVEAEWIVTGPSTRGPGAATLDAFIAQGLSPPKMMIECDSISTMLALLVGSDTVCILAGSLVSREPFSRIVTRVAIPGRLPAYGVSLFRKAHSPLMPAAANFATLVRRHAHYLNESDGTLRPDAALHRKRSMNSVP